MAETEKAEPMDLAAVAREHFPRVERLLLRILGPRSDMEDLVQTVFLELCRALPRHRGDAALSTFIGGITVNVARRAMRPSAFFRRRIPLAVEPESCEPDAERNAVARAQIRRVREVLDGIAPKKRIAFCLWAFEGMSVDAIAEMTGASASATWSRIHYAQRELRARAVRDPVLREAIGGAK